MALWTCVCRPLMSSKVRKKAGERVQICFKSAISTRSRCPDRTLLLIIGYNSTTKISIQMFLNSNNFQMEFFDLWFGSWVRARPAEDGEGLGRGEGEVRLEEDIRHLAVTRPELLRRSGDRSGHRRRRRRRGGGGVDRRMQQQILRK